MSEEAYPKDTRTIYNILKHWEVLLNYEENKSCKLFAIGDRMAALEGRNYLKLSLDDAMCLSFFSGAENQLGKKIDRDVSRFLLRLKLIEQRIKFKNLIEQTEFFAGYPVIEVSAKGQKPYITSLVKFLISGVVLPQSIQQMTITSNNVQKIENQSNEIIIKKPVIDLESASDIYFTDTNLLEEVIGLQQDNIHRFVKYLNKEDLKENPLSGKILSELFDNTTLESISQSGLQTICGELNKLFAHETEYRLRFFPYGLIWFADSGQPTYSLRKDIRSIIQDEKLDGMDKSHVFMNFFNGKSEKGTPSKIRIISADGQNATNSQKKVLETYSASRLNVIEGPPGTGKTKVIRDLIVSRLFELCTYLKNGNIPENINELTSLITSMNNIAVDHALNFFEFTDETTLLPCFIRLGNRKILRFETLAYLQQYADRLRTFNIFELSGEYKENLEKIGNSEILDKLSHQELLSLIFRTLTLWVVQNQNSALKLLGKLLEELEESSSIRCLFNTKNRELFFMMFPIVGTTLLSVTTVFPLKKSLWGLTVIDESGQCPPQNVLSVLYRTQKLIMFGDLNQLEPIYTVTPDEYGRLKALKNIKLPDNICETFIPLDNSGISLQHIAQNGYHSFSALTEHFRCREQIIGFCSSMCGYHLKVKTTDYADKSALGEKPFYLIPVKYDEESYSGSWLNAGEAQSTVDLYLHLISLGFVPEDIVILTPFRGQMNFILYKLRSLFSANRRLLPKIKMEQLTVATAHRFQGGERRIVLFSPVTSVKEPDFLNSKVNLLNLSVSRAREHFILIGSPENMKRGKYTSKLMEYIYQYGNELTLPQQTLNY